MWMRGQPKHLTETVIWFKCFGAWVHGLTITLTPTVKVKKCFGVISLIIKCVANAI